MSTRPDTPSTRRTTSGASPRTGMQSTRRTEPSGVVNVVSRTRLFGRYRRVVLLDVPAGAICHAPCVRSPSSAAKHAPESKRGRHSQSIDPSLETRAAVCVSPMRA